MERLTILLTDINLVSTVVRLLLAAVLGGLIGTERGRRGRAAGMRTHVLVCIGAALAVLMGLYAADVLGADSDPLRIGAQVVSGIGFLGGGMILVRGKRQITGLTTAAGLWTTAVIGLAVGVGFYAAALAAAVLVLLTNTLLPRWERGAKRIHDVLYVELTEEQAVMPFMAHLQEAYGIDAARMQPAKSGMSGHIGFALELPAACTRDEEEICRELAALPYVAFAIEQAE